MSNPKNQSIKKVVITSVIGNALEFYDFTLCGVFIAILAKTYFPSTNPTLSLFAGFFAFSAAFWTRPFGAYVFGYIGDKFGRKVALTLSVSLMGLPTFVIGIVPGYETLGILAPIVLVLCRMVQGLCTGGEYNGAAIFALEHSNRQPGFISGFISASCVLGAIMATGMGVLVFHPSMPDWAWRIPFLMGAMISVLGYYLRRSGLETAAYLQSQKSSSIESSTPQPFVSILKESKVPSLVTVTMGAMNGALSYTLFGFLTIYLLRYGHVPPQNSALFNLLGLLSFMVLCPCFGLLSDKLSPRRSILLSLGMIFVASAASFSLLQSTSVYSLLLGQILLGALVASFVGPSHAFMQTLFPTKTRYTGVAVSFSLGMAIAGGTTPMLLTYLIDRSGNLYVPALVLMIYAALTLVVVGVGTHWIRYAESRG